MQQGFMAPQVHMIPMHQQGGWAMPGMPMQQMMGGVMMHGPRPQMPPHSVANTQGPPAGPPVPGEDAPPLPSEPPPPDEVVLLFF